MTFKKMRQGESQELVFKEWETMKKCHLENVRRIRRDKEEMAFSKCEGEERIKKWHFKM